MMTSTEKPVDIKILQMYNEIGFKLVPLGADRKTPNIDSTKAIFHDSSYWSNDKLRKENHRFINVATTYGRTCMRDGSGDLYLNEIDIDSEQVFTILAIVKHDGRNVELINELCNKTFSIKTKKTHGYRIYWLSHKQNPPIPSRRCKMGFEFEIKTDNTLGHGTLPPSCHRDHPDFHYQNIGQNKIVILDTLYDEFLKLLSDCLKPEKYKEDNCAKDVGSSEKKTVCLSDEQVVEIIQLISQYYLKGARHEIVYALSGILYKENVSIQSAIRLIDEVCTRLVDEEKSNRLTVLNNTYQKGVKGENITGSSHLIETLSRSLSTKNAQTVLDNILNVLRRDNSDNATLFDTHVPDWQLNGEIKGELCRHNCFIANYEPIKFYIAHRGLKQIVRGYIGDEGEDKAKIVKKLRLGAPMINAIPTSVTKYESMVNVETRYKIALKTNTHKTITTETNTIEGIVAELRDKGLVPQMREAEAALTGILNSMEKMGKVVVTHNIETPGFYLVDGKIECFGLEFREPSTEQIRQCADFMNELVAKYVKKDKDGEVINDRRILPATIIKWSISAPFDYVMKYDKKWIPWPHLNGWPSTAKSTLGDYCLALWRKHGDPKYTLSFKSINTEARLGQVISQSTLPVVINEVGDLSKDNYSHMVEMIKSGIENRTARSTFNRKGRFIGVPALSAVILTGNPAPPKDGGYRRKTLPIIFTSEDKFDRETEGEEFRKWVTPRLDLLGTLGDFAVNYIMKKPQIVKEKSWNDIGIEVLSEFYAKGERDVPNWINLVIEYDRLEQTADETVLMMRSYLINLINETFNRYRLAITMTEYVEGQNISLMTKLKDCCDRNLIPFIYYRPDKSVFYITPEIMSDLQKNKLGDLVSSHKGLAKLLGFEYKNMRVGTGGKQIKVISVPYVLMNELLECKIEDVTVDSKMDNRTNNQLENQESPTPPTSIMNRE